MSNVVGLRESYKLRVDSAQRVPEQTLITHLEELLQRARSGDLQGIVYVESNYAQIINYNHVGIYCAYKMIGGIQHLSSALIQGIDS